METNDDPMTTLTLRKSTKARIEEKKAHGNQSFDEILCILLDQLDDCCKSKGKDCQGCKE